MKKTITIKAKVYKPKRKSYPKANLQQGTKVEAEHTPTKKLASAIAKNHLDEDVKYYEKLKIAEQKVLRGPYKKRKKKKR